MDRYRPRKHRSLSRSFEQHGLGAERRIITKLLIEKEDKLGHDLEQLEFAENRAADGRDRLNRLRGRLDSVGAEHREQAERMIANSAATQKLLNGFCHHLRVKVSSRL
jgi:hypothetical protein